MAITRSTSSSEVAKTVSDVLNKKFGRQAINVTLAGETNNSLTYYATLGPDVELGRVPDTIQPGCVFLPKDVTKVFMKFTAPDAMLNDDVVVENEVAMATLFRDALKTYRGRHLVADVYGWQQASAGQRGWILMEHLPGKSISREEFAKLDLDQAKVIINGVANLFRQIQQYDLPASYKGYGGARFEFGQVVPGPTPIYGASKGCDTYHELYTEYFNTQLDFMEKCKIIEGWKGTDMRPRLDKFVAGGFKPVVESILPLKPRQTLVHGDLDLHNMLFDPKTHAITGLLDFNFSHVASMCDEYFYSLSTLNTIVFPPVPGRWTNIQRFLLYGETNEAVEEAEKSKGWEVMKLTNEAFFIADVQRPFDLMPGIEATSMLYWFIQAISPPVFFMEKCVARMGKEGVEAEKATSMANLEKLLAKYGY